MNDYEDNVNETYDTGCESEIKEVHYTAVNGERRDDACDVSVDGLVFDFN